MTDEDALELAERLYSALQDADGTASFLDLCAPDAVVEYPAERRLPYGGTWQGRQAITEFLEAHDAAEDILAFEPSEMVANDGVVFVIGFFEGRARQTDRTWTTAFVHVLSMGDGHLIRWRAFFDTAAAVEAHATD